MATWAADYWEKFHLVELHIRRCLLLVCKTANQARGVLSSVEAPPSAVYKE